MCTREHIHVSVFVFSDFILHISENGLSFVLFGCLLLKCQLYNYIINILIDLYANLFKSLKGLIYKSNIDLLSVCYLYKQRSFLKKKIYVMR